MQRRAEHDIAVGAVRNRVARREAAFQGLFPDSLSRLAVRTDEERLTSLVRFFQARMAAGPRR